MIVVMIVMWTCHVDVVHTRILQAKCDKGARISIVLAGVKTAFLYGDARRSFCIELPPEDTETSVNLNAPLWNSRPPDDLAVPFRKTLLDMKFNESVTHPGCFNMRHETFSFVCMRAICGAQYYVKI